MNLCRLLLLLLPNSARWMDGLCSHQPSPFSPVLTRTSEVSELRPWTWVRPCLLDPEGESWAYVCPLSCLLTQISDWLTLYTWFLNSNSSFLMQMESCWSVYCLVETESWSSFLGSLILPRKPTATGWSPAFSGLLTQNPMNAACRRGKPFFSGTCSSDPLASLGCRKCGTSSKPAPVPPAPLGTSHY